jgi:hypothetical protein
LKFCPFLSNHIFPVVLNGILPTRSTSFNIWFFTRTCIN